MSEHACENDRSTLRSARSETHEIGGCAGNLQHPLRHADRVLRGTAGDVLHLEVVNQLLRAQRVSARARASARRLSRPCRNRALYSGWCLSSARMAFPGFRSYLSSMDFGTTARAATQGAKPRERRTSNVRKPAWRDGTACGARPGHHVARCARCSAAQRQLHAAASAAARTCRDVQQRVAEAEQRALQSGRHGGGI